MGKGKGALSEVRTAPMATMQTCDCKTPDWLLLVHQPRVVRPPPSSNALTLSAMDVVHPTPSVVDGNTADSRPPRPQRRRWPTSTIPAMTTTHPPSATMMTRPPHPRPLANGATTLGSHDHQHPQLPTTVKSIGFPDQYIDAHQVSHFFLLIAPALMTTAAMPSPNIGDRDSPQPQHWRLQ